MGVLTLKFNLFPEIDIINSLRRQFKTMEDYQSLQMEPLKDTPVAGKPVQLELIGSGEH